MKQNEIFFDKNGNEIKEGCIVDYDYEKDVTIRTMIRKDEYGKLVFSQPKREKMCSCGGMGDRRCYACNYRRSYDVMDARGYDTSNRSQGVVNSSNCSDMRIVSINSEELVDWIVLPCNKQKKSSCACSSHTIPFQHYARVPNNNPFIVKL